MKIQSAEGQETDGGQEDLADIDLRLVINYLQN